MNQYKNCVYCSNNVIQQNLILHLSHCKKKYTVIKNIINYIRLISGENRTVVDNRKLDTLYKKLFYSDIQSLIKKEEFINNSYRDILNKNRNKIVETKQANSTNSTNSSNSSNSTNYSSDSAVYRIQSNSTNYSSNSTVYRIQPSYYNNDIVLYEKSIISYLMKYEELFREYIENKVVALVGPAQSILLSNNGKLIDKFQVVVRLNKALPLPENIASHIGSKTDVIYNSLNVTDYPGENRLSAELYKRSGVQFISSSYPMTGLFKQDIINYINQYKFRIPFKVFNNSKYEQLEKAIKCRPYTGTCAITDLLSYNIKLLFVTGLDFYQTKYYEEYRVISDAVQNNTRNNYIHQALPQLNYFRYLCLNDNRIILDKFLERVVFEKYDYILNSIYKYNDAVFIFRDREHQSIIDNFDKIIYYNNYKNRRINFENYLIFTVNRRLFVDNNCVILMSKEHNSHSIGTVYHYHVNDPNQYMFINKRFLDYVKNLFHKIKMRKVNTVLYYILALIRYRDQNNFRGEKQIGFHQDEFVNFPTDDLNIIKFLIRRKIIGLESD